MAEYLITLKLTVDETTGHQSTEIVATQRVEDDRHQTFPVVSVEGYTATIALSSWEFRKAEFAPVYASMMKPGGLAMFGSDGKLVPVKVVETFTDTPMMTQDTPGATPVEEDFPKFAGHIGIVVAPSKYTFTVRVEFAERIEGTRIWVFSYRPKDREAMIHGARVKIDAHGMAVPIVENEEVVVRPITRGDMGQGMAPRETRVWPMNVEAPTEEDRVACRNCVQWTEKSHHSEWPDSYCHHHRNVTDPDYVCGMFVRRAKPELYGYALTEAETLAGEDSEKGSDQS